MRSEIQDFFDRLAPNWDDNADDDESFVRALFARIPIREGEKVLDVACGTGVVTGLLHELTHEDVLGIDIAPKMIEIAQKKYAGREGISFRAGDFLTLEEGEYDVIVLYNAYPHFLSPEALSAQFARRLKAGGKFAIVHSLGRERLVRHHDGLGPKISRDLLPVEEESTFFQKDFDISVADEGKDHYLIIGRKR